MNYKTFCIVLPTFKRCQLLILCHRLRINTVWRWVTHTFLLHLKLPYDGILNIQYSLQYRFYYLILKLLANNIQGTVLKVPTTLVSDGVFFY